jgi:hypothetical protein
LIAAFVQRKFSTQAGMIALWIACLCPFTANYVAAPLAETLSVFCVALGFYSCARVLEDADRSRVNWPAIGGLIFAWSYGTLLRPDGAILAAVLFAALILYGRRGWGTLRAARLALACAAIALLPFAAWTERNWKVFHVFQPLAPRSAADPGDFTAPGFELWTRTWLEEFASTYEIYWNAPGYFLDIADLPTRAFDSPAEYEATKKLFAEYNRGTALTPAIDAAFDSLGEQRRQAHPVRYYLVLPLMRLADMWLRPRVEMFNIELRWWQYSKHHAETWFAFAFGALNLLYLAAALAGAWYWRVFRAPMVAYVVLRSVLLATLTAPEPRYTLECFPVILSFAALAVYRWFYGQDLRAAHER